MFKEPRIDFCCGGDPPLGDVFKEKERDKTVVLGELNSAFDNWKKDDHEVVDWDAVPPAELIDHVVHTHHAYLNEELPALGQIFA